MKDLTKILGPVWKFLGPQTKVNHEKKYVEIKEPSLCGTNLTEAYYTLKGYEVRRI